MGAVKRVVAASVSACLLFFTASCTDSKTDGGLKADQVYAFGTLFEQKVWGADNSVAENVASYLAQQELVCSHTDPNSQLSVLNSKGQGSVSPELERYISYAVTAHGKTGGIFDYALGNVIDLWEENSYSPPGQEAIASALKVSGADKIDIGEDGSVSTNGAKINLGGIAKGAVVGDALAQYMKAGVTAGLISCSSSVGVTGTKPDGEMFKIGIRDPDGDGNSFIATVELSDSILSTSGDYERGFTAEDGTRYHHILDPVTGYPANRGLRSVTVIASADKDSDLAYTGAMTDALSTALFVQGLNNGSISLLRELSFEAIFVMDGGIYITQGLEGSVTVTNSDYSLQSAEVAR